MFYVLVHEMPLQMAFVALVIWIAMTALGKGQTLFKLAVIGSALLFGMIFYLGERQLAVALQIASTCLLLLGWICKVRWQIRHARSGKENREPESPLPPIRESSERGRSGQD